MSETAGARRATVTGALLLLAVFVCRSAEAQGDPSPAQRGIELYNQGQFAAAEAALRGVSGSEADAYLAASLAKLASTEGDAARKAARYSEAESAAKQALSGDATNAVAAEALGEVLVGQGKLDEAIDRLSSVLAAKPDVAYAYYWRGKAYNAKKQTARMVDDFQAFVRLRPDAPQAAAVRQLLQALR